MITIVLIVLACIVILFLRALGIKVPIPLFLLKMRIRISSFFKEKEKTFIICGRVVVRTNNELFVQRENGAILSVISYSEENPFSEYDFDNRKRYAFPCSQGNNLQEFILNKKLTPP